ncbi:MAG: N-6 DNA Methylase family protein [Candidatus Gallionella acididurans]|uniref:site-specific DNA-methyltransferase (adenine-specific) n=1 Tax=Candidatus Gallionella acididurans TaxID=1796491 RepID=A0A139BPY4_9PROT|nr:MAG: N-6 DNA Methylase family protein [Candidatus Gallionella acididurans]
MSLKLAHEKLGWPSPEEIRNPSGEGGRIFAELVEAKIQRAIALLPGTPNVKIGVLLRNSMTTVTEAPLAVVAEFSGKASDSTLRELQRLAWNFSHSPTVVTIEEGLLRVWTCCEPPDDARPLGDYVVHELSDADLADIRSTKITQRATQVLHWVNLVSGQFFRERSERFNRDQRADQMLLGNLRHLRKMLQEAGLTDNDVCHDLLARIVFIQFLFDRKDSKGNAALNRNKLASLHEEGVLKKEHKDLHSILENYNETYRLFDWLNTRFNGDLFPGKGNTPRQRELGWQTEKRVVKSVHLELLRHFISGDLDMPSGQRCLWPQYSFDAIPLEFISSIYETFVTERASGEGIFYTPQHLVDFILDRVLPWDGDQWNLKILDPACGSGVFLVKAFQRLIHRWKRTHPGQAVRAEILKGLLEKNIFGVDKDPHAVRVASFSLYLAMCDEIDPKHYWTQVVFPTMRGQRLINSDFFEETHQGFRTKEDAASFDLVIGNAPWGEKLLTPAAKDWAEDAEHRWPLANKGIGTLFLPKAAALAKLDGRVSMIQSASSLLFNQSHPARDFRKQFFTTFRAEEVVNLSALRFKVFNRKAHATKTSVAPSCVVTFSPHPPADELIAYIVPKQTEDLADEFEIIVEPDDYKTLHPYDAAADTDVWSTLVWGQKRDWGLIKKLRLADNLAKLEEGEFVRCNEGIIRGRNPSRQKEHVWLMNRHILDTDSFSDSSSILLNARELPKITNPKVERPRNERAFFAPQLLIKQGWSVKTKRFQARLVVPDELGNGVVCSQSYLSVCASPGHESLIEAASLSCNSLLAVYFLLLTSGRFSTYRPEALVSDISRIPIPNFNRIEFKDIHSNADIDSKVFEAFGLKDAEKTLIEDLCKITLEDFKGKADSPGRQRTQRRSKPSDEPELRAYCEYFSRVLKAGFGQDKHISATVFQESNKDFLPYRLIAFELNQPSNEKFRVASFETSALLAELETLNRTWLRDRKSLGGSIYHQRVVRIYDYRDGVPTIFILKPDARRYWTRSMGLHDADEVAGDFNSWQNTKDEIRD